MRRLRLAMWRMQELKRILVGEEEEEEELLFSLAERRRLESHFEKLSEINQGK